MFAALSRLAPPAALIALILAGPVWARDRAIPAAAPDLEADGGAARLVPAIAVAREGDLVAYSVTLQNPSNVDVRDVFLTSQVAAGTTFLDVGPNPPHSGFRALEDGGPVWLSEAVPARSVSGPFLYRVRLTGDTAGAVAAWVHWKAPAEGSNLSGSVRVLPAFNAATLAAAPVDVRGAKRWLVRNERTVAQANESLPGYAPEFRYVVGGVDSLTQDGVTTTAGPGGALFDRGAVHVHANPDDRPGRILTFAAVPAGSAPVADSPNTTTLFESEELGLRDGGHTFSLTLVEIGAGGSVPTHYHSGSGVVYLLEGSIVYNLLSGSVVYGPGSIFVEHEGMLHSANNTGRTGATILAVRLVPEGQPVTTYTVVSPHPWSVR